MGSWRLREVGCGSCRFDGASGRFLGGSSCLGLVKSCDVEFGVVSVRWRALSPGGYPAPGSSGSCIRNDEEQGDRIGIWRLRCVIDLVFFAETFPGQGSCLQNPVSSHFIRKRIALQLLATSEQLVLLSGPDNICASIEISGLADAFMATLSKFFAIFLEGSVRSTL